ncbi:hypothetical protein NDU88_002069 [Pleurodeles waltl]|uniref:Uncharacterized protein n=1 Tax=Pleurodeles waltl TaxID=8319 RepID=A0AAV7NCJ4_PLEWA|nr:hypothetical protein NDU88_002069 [Pleurodeles waltl]
MYESPRGTHENLLDVSMTKHAYVIRNSLDEKKSGRSYRKKVVTGTEKHQQEDGQGQKAGRLEDEKQRKTANGGWRTHFFKCPEVWRWLEMWDKVVLGRTDGAEGVASRASGAEGPDWR